MKVIVAHVSPDLDAIASIWVIRKFLPGWNEAEVKFVLAGERLEGSYSRNEIDGPIEKIGEVEVIHVDTGLGKFDHHHLKNENVCAASLAFDYIKETIPEQLKPDKIKTEAVEKLIGYTLIDDHFQQVYYKEPQSYLYDFLLFGVIDGFCLQYPKNDVGCIDFGTKCLDAVFHTLENRIWAQREIEEKGIEFETRWGKGLGIETVNDVTLELSQRMGYVVVARKDPSSGAVRIKAWPERIEPGIEFPISDLKSPKADLTQAYEMFRKMDPDASWFLHVSKKMLLNGSTKDPSAKRTRLSLKEVIEVLESI
ncbi:DHH family phosphoesterase [Candidatus Parcubacteria bacterium]|nr:MAG: DHH family phosphoesterase [Candidatus Parcubacteria bacterium]